MKSNSLARGLEGVPEYWRDYGSRILLVVLVAAIVFLLVRYWNDKKATDARIVAESVDTATTSVHELAQLPMQSQQRPAAEVAEARDKARQQADQAINTVLNTSKDPKMLAFAYLTRGDLNWTLANFPELPGASTLPSSLQITNRDAYLDQARASYERVLDPAYSASIENVYAAHMGLAAIAENQGQWDRAKAQYQAIADDAKMPAAFKDLAKRRLTNLAKYQTPAVLVPAPPIAPEPPQAASAPATTSSPATSEPAATQPVTNAPSSAAPATGASAPAMTQPAVPSTTTTPATSPPSTQPVSRP